jgi:hypothetical protein
MPGQTGLATPSRQSVSPQPVESHPELSVDTVDAVDAWIVMLALLAACDCWATDLVKAWLLSLSSILPGITVAVSFCVL